MDRASDSGSEGWGFESLPAYQIKTEDTQTGILCFYSLREGTRRSQMQYAGGILLPPVQKLVATLIFARPPQGQKCKRGLLFPLNMQRQASLPRKKQNRHLGVSPLSADFILLIDYTVAASSIGKAFHFPPFKRWISSVARKNFSTTLFSG